MASGSRTKVIFDPVEFIMNPGSSPTFPEICPMPYLGCRNEADMISEAPQALLS